MGKTVHTDDHDLKERQSPGNDRNAPDDRSRCREFFQHNKRRAAWYRSGDELLPCLVYLFAWRRRDRILLDV